jgi:hypothetical protein
MEADGNTSKTSKRPPSERSDLQMAQAEKHGRNAAHRLLGHYERTAQNPMNKEIDKERTPQNYRLFTPRKDRETGRELTDLEYYKQRLSQLKVWKRKDIKTLCSWVVHIPEHVRPEDEKRFFTECLKFMANRYGADNVVAAHVHKDEKTPHCHIAFIPSPDGVKVSAKDVINLKELTVFHTEIQAYFDSLTEPIRGAKVKTGYMKGRQNRTVKQMKKERNVFKLDRGEVERKGVFINR